jgi:hypothetical protein
MFRIPSPVFGRGSYYLGFGTALPSGLVNVTHNQPIGEVLRTFSRGNEIWTKDRYKLDLQRVSPDQDHGISWTFGGEN